MSTALITGPTAGIGRQIAVELSRRGHDLILVARDQQRLQALADELGNATVLPADLSDRDQMRAVEEAAVGVDWLVNNAGFGINDSFLVDDVEEEQKMLDVLVTAPMRLCHAALPPMVQRGYGRVLNVSSVASWVPFGTYAAAKAWLKVFSESMAGQTPDDVHVTALCPGFTRTEFHERAGMQAQVPGFMWLTADEVAVAGVKDCEAGKVLSIPGVQYRAMAGALHLTPGALKRKMSAPRGGD